ncbi:MAG: HEPN domain-containing protein [Anaerolineae bacterium]
MTAEQLALLRKASNSLRAANLLAEQGYHDFAASRAYYAMFYVASAFLLGEGLTFSKHSTVIAMFGQHFAKTGRVPVEFHRYLIEGQDSRNVGDYDIGPGLTQTQAYKQITRAEQFLELAQQHIGPIPPP